MAGANAVEVPKGDAAGLAASVDSFAFSVAKPLELKPVCGFVSVDFESASLSVLESGLVAPSGCAKLAKLKAEPV